MEITYLLCQGDFLKFDEVMNWDLERYLFQGEYLLRKKIIENLK